MGWRNTTPICFLLLIQIAETTGSRCSDAAQTAGIPYIRMCKDGNVTSDRVILDTHGAEDTGETTCSCIVNATLMIFIYIEYYGEGLNPNTICCGSEVVVPKSGSVEEIRYQCNTSPVRTFHIRPVTITWQRTSSGDSKYCLNVTGDVIIPNTTFTITCTKPFDSRPSPTTMPTTRTTTITSGGITNEPITSDVETETTSPVSNSTSSTETHGEENCDKYVQECRCGVNEKQYIFLPVYAVAVLAICLCLVSLYAAAMTFLYVRRYVEKRSLRESDTRSEMPDEGGYENMSVTATVDRTYDGLELAEVNLNVDTYDELRN